MHEQPERVDQFKADVADLRIKDPSTNRDRLVARVGLAAMAAGIAVTALAYSLSHGTTNPLEQRDALVLAVLGVAVVVAGAALYVRAAIAGFLRFWLLRDIHERRAQTDRLLDARGGPQPDLPSSP
jgi:uncharacterized membrane protein YidH (DUF202 family)